ncbi:MAG TPA: TonB-dependent receptor [Candidatus Margulisiibacteriota bacterium]|nr:TonB-dependent receptor [Candidatus Margulisiibacteriota bacterium]
MWLITFILLLILPGTCFSEPFSLERIVVKNESNRASGGISRKDLEGSGILAFSEELDNIAGLDLRTRGAVGMQSDISLRGSTFEQVAVLLDGLKINDPQSGHYNLDIPLTPADIEKIEVTKEGATSLYGSGAFAGSVNIITRKADTRKFSLSSAFGEHALFSEGLSLSLPHKEYFGRFSYAHKSSNGGTSNTDFDSSTTSLFLGKDEGGLGLNTLLSFQKNDFGADSFYSNLFPAEEEHTRTLLFKTGLSVKKEDGSCENSLYLRRHEDKFILDRNNPVSVNYHTTYVYGLNSDFAFPLRAGDLSLGLSLTEEEINSTNLGKHSRLQEGLKAGLLPDFGERFNVNINSRVDNFRKWGLQPSWNIGLGYLLNNMLQVKSSLAYAFRLPSFTELYYSDAGNQGNPGLGIEESENAGLGIALRQEQVDLSIDFFYRRGRNLIDWTRASSNERWQATNLGRTDIRGIEFSSGFYPAFHLKGVTLDKLSFSYAHNTLVREETGFLSKYALDILRDHLVMDIDSSFWGNKLSWELSYNQRHYGETYFVGNLCISRKVIRRSFSFEPFLRIDNFSNTEYSEVGGVLQPGRWVKSGLRFEW